MISKLNTPSDNLNSLSPPYQQFQRTNHKNSINEQKCIQLNGQSKEKESPSHNQLTQKDKCFMPVSLQFGSPSSRSSSCQEDATFIQLFSSPNIIDKENNKENNSSPKIILQKSEDETRDSEEKHSENKQSTSRLLWMRKSLQKPFSISNCGSQYFLQSDGESIKRKKFLSFHEEQSEDFRELISCIDSAGKSEMISQKQTRKNSCCCTNCGVKTRYQKKIDKLLPQFKPKQVVRNYYQQIFKKSITEIKKINRFVKSNFQIKETKQNHQLHGYQSPNRNLPQQLSNFHKTSSSQPSSLSMKFNNRPQFEQSNDILNYPQKKLSLRNQTRSNTIQPRNFIAFKSNPLQSQIKFEEGGIKQLNGARAVQDKEIVNTNQQTNDGSGISQNNQNFDIIKQIESNFHQVTKSSIKRSSAIENITENIKKEDEIKLKDKFKTNPKMKNYDSNFIVSLGNEIQFTNKKIFQKQQIQKQDLENLNETKKENQREQYQNPFLRSVSTKKSTKSKQMLSQYFLNSLQINNQSPFFISDDAKKELSYQNSQAGEAQIDNSIYSKRKMIKFTALGDNKQKKGSIVDFESNDQNKLIKSATYCNFSSVTSFSSQKHKFPPLVKKTSQFSSRQNSIFYQLTKELSLTSIQKFSPHPCVSEQQSPTQWEEIDKKCSTGIFNPQKFSDNMSKPQIKYYSLQNLSLEQSTNSNRLSNNKSGMKNNKQITLKHCPQSFYQPDIYLTSHISKKKINKRIFN